MVSSQWLDRIEQHISLLDQKIPVLTMNHQVKLPCGGTRWHQWTDRAIFDEHGILIEYQAVGRDINDLKLAEQALQKVRDNLEQRVEEHTAALKRTYNRLIQTERIASLGLLVAGIAHEINNPNNFITFNIPILRDYLQEIMTIVDSYAGGKENYELFGMPYPEFRKDLFKLLNNIEHGSNRISSTVSRLREFARPQGNENLRFVNLRPVIEQSIELCQSQVKKRVQILSVHIPQNLPLIHINPQIIEQVLINLVTNAAQAADKENSWIKVGVELGETEKDYIILEVKDNGCGISSKFDKEIFDPFYTTKGTEMGTGLGLYISKNLIESLDGRIEMKSKLGEGSTFRVILPKLKQGQKQNRHISDTQVIKS
jgi:signal transduction histidine kinase